MATDLPPNKPLLQIHLSFSLFLKQFRKSSLVFLKYSMIKSMTNAAPRAIQQEGSQVKMWGSAIICLIHQAWHCATSGSSQKLKWPWKVKFWINAGQWGTHSSTGEGTHRRGLPGGRNNGTDVFKAKQSILRDLCGNTFCNNFFF